MKTKHLLLTGALALALTPSLFAANVRYDGTIMGNSMKIEGTSSVHDWHCNSMIIRGSFEVDAAFETDLTLKSVPNFGAGKTPTVTVSIPVRTLKSSSGPAMDGIMMSAMKGGEYKEITYKATEMVIKGDVPAAGSPVSFDCKGDLTVSGKTKNVAFPVTMKRDGAKIEFAGTVKIKMTDFGITPPAPSIGGVSISTGDEVTLTWTWKAEKK